jgi:hypothetical protein
MAAPNRNRKTVAAKIGEIRTIAIAAGIGAASGLVSYFVPRATYTLFESTPSVLAVWFIVSAHWPGIIYGLVLGGYLYWARRATVWRVVAFVPIVVVSWYAALLSYNDAPRWFEYSDLGYWLNGLLAGSVGAVGLVAGLWLLFPFFRRVRAAAVTLGVGASLG